MLVSSGWLCGECNEWHDWLSDAEECCQPEPEPAWKCIGCFDIHDDELSAEMCCADLDEMNLD